MKIDSLNENIQKHNIDHQISFGIEQNASAFSILADRLYTRKEQSVIRELSTNAYDEHIVAGKADVPFDVHLPTTLENWFSIRDYGNGLSEEDAATLYTRFFKSTKRDNNLQTGCLGLGSKSPFAVTNSFTVESIHNGFKTTYTCYKDDNDGAPKMSRLDSRATTEPSGLKVQFVVDGGHYDWRWEAARVYKFFKLKPNCNIPLNFELGTPILSGSNWTLYDFNTAEDSNTIRDYSYALMGNVAYPISFDAIKTTTADENKTIRRFRYVKGLVVDFPLGELGFTTNREALEYNKKTNSALLECIYKVTADIKLAIQNSLDECPNLFLALKKAVELRNFFNNHFGDDLNKELIGDHLTYKGNAFPEGFFKTYNVSVPVECRDVGNHDRKKCKEDGRHFQIRQATKVSFSFNRPEYWFLDDGTIKNLEKRVKLFLAKEGERASGYIVNAAFKDTVNSIFGLNAPETIFVDNAFLPEIVRKQRSAGGSKGKTVEYIPALEFRYKINSNKVSLTEEVQSTISVKSASVQYYMAFNKKADEIELPTGGFNKFDFEQVLGFALKLGYKLPDEFLVKVVTPSKAETLKLDGRVNFINLPKHVSEFVQKYFDSHVDSFKKLLATSILEPNVIRYLAGAKLDNLSETSCLRQGAIGNTLKLAKHPIVQFAEFTEKVGFHFKASQGISWGYDGTSLVALCEKLLANSRCFPHSISNRHNDSHKEAIHLFSQFNRIEPAYFDTVANYLESKGLLKGNFNLSVDDISELVSTVTVSLSI